MTSLFFFGMVEGEEFRQNNDCTLLFFTSERHIFSSGCIDK